MDYIINYGMHKQKIIIKTSLMGCFRPLSNEHIVLIFTNTTDVSNDKNVKATIDNI